MGKLRDQLSMWGQQVPGIRHAMAARKLYLSKTWQTHYAQFAEDVSVLRHFPQSYRGIYVDVGCYHPVKHSNTHALYKRGWRRVNVDIDPIKITAFDMKRPRDTNIACAVSNTNGTATCYTHNWWSLTTSLDAEYAESIGAKHERKVETRRLTDLLDESEFAGQQIDFLTVDAEAHDLEVLQSLDMRRYQPRMIAVESYHRGWEAVESSPLHKFIRSHDYQLVNWCGLTLLYGHASLVAEHNAQEQQAA